MSPLCSPPYPSLVQIHLPRKSAFRERFCALTACRIPGERRKKSQPPQWDLRQSHGEPLGGTQALVLSAKSETDSSPLAPASSLCPSTFTSCSCLFPGQTLLTPCTSAATGVPVQQGQASSRLAPVSAKAPEPCQQDGPRGEACGRSSPVGTQTRVLQS